MNPAAAAAAAAAAAGSDTDTSGSDTGSLAPSPSHVSNAVTLAADPGIGGAPPPQTLTLALPVQTKPNRDDCWSDGATSALIDAWGERFIDGQIKQKQWQEVADAVSSRDDYTKPPKSDHQCKNRIDTLKKKYKIEASKLASGAAARSTWPYFPQLDILLGSSSNPTPISKLPPPDSDSSDDSPPEPVNGRQRHQQQQTPLTATQEVMRSIMRFGEVYERVESSKLRQEMQMEEQRLGFERELAEQRMQFFMRAHLELSGAGAGNQRKRERDGVSRRNGNGSSS